MLWIHLLRVRCEPKMQTGFFDERREPSAVVMDAIRSTPTAPVGRGSTWHIGRPEGFHGALGFKMGRTAALKVPKFDVERHDFFEAEVESAPYTFGVYDAETQACGIIKTPGVSLKASEIAGKLEKLLNSTEFPEKAGCRIVVDPVSDPEGFIDQLRSADNITRFRFTASFPNPFDVESLIQGPAEKFTQAANGERTTVEVHGEHLDQGLLEELARGVASTGDQAAATVRATRGRRGKRIYLKGNPVQEPVEEQPTPSSLYHAMRDATRAAYNRVRNMLQ